MRQGAPRVLFASLAGVSEWSCIWCGAGWWCVLFDHEKDERNERLGLTEILVGRLGAGDIWPDRGFKPCQNGANGLLLNEGLQCERRSLSPPLPQLQCLLGPAYGKTQLRSMRVGAVFCLV